MAREWDDLDIELGIENGRQRKAQAHENGHDLSYVGNLSRLTCPLCGDEAATAIVGCAGCLPAVVSEYATHMFTAHHAELDQALEAIVLRQVGRMAGGN